jgi:hypothetical protein
MSSSTTSSQSISTAETKQSAPETNKPNSEQPKARQTFKLVHGPNIRLEKRGVSKSKNLSICGPKLPKNRFVVGMLKTLFSYIGGLKSYTDHTSRIFLHRAFSLYKSMIYVTFRDIGIGKKFFQRKKNLVFLLLVGEFENAIKIFSHTNFDLEKFFSKNFEIVVSLQRTLPSPPQHLGHADKASCYQEDSVPNSTWPFSKSRVLQVTVLHALDSGTPSCPIATYQ